MTMNFACSTYIAHSLSLDRIDSSHTLCLKGESSFNPSYAPSANR